MRAASSLCGCLLAAVTVAAEARPAAYTAERVGRTVRLIDTDRQVVVSIAPFRGNVTFEMRVKGHDVLHFPVASIEDPRAGHFQLTDSPRDDWTIAVGARTQWLLAENKIPTGETQAIERLFPDLEPMAGITNAMNAAHKGLYKELQSIPAGGTWEESFWVRPSGF